MADWVCDKCSYDNSALIEWCEMCDSPKRAGVADAPTDKWGCKVCEYAFNNPQDGACVMCESPNPTGSSSNVMVTRYLHCDWHSKDSSRAFVEILKSNIVVYRNCLDSATQQLLLEDCNVKLNRVVLGGMAGEMKPGPTHCFNYNTGWVPGQTEDKQAGDPDCLQLASNLHANLVSELVDEIAALNLNQPDESLQIPDRFVAQSLLGRQYSIHQGLGMHLDPPNLNWVFILSIGADTCFQLVGSDNIPMELVLRSGDAIFFNGSKIKHGIKEFIRDTQPAWWTEQDYQRVGLQMRGYQHPRE